MAVDKKTLLREALKQVQAGKIDKAVETYKAIVKIDPRDAPAHNTLGDLYIKQGKKKDAIAEYLEVAAFYEKDGFALRAIAICQKVINLDPELIAVRIKLGDLYSGQKLPAEGRAQYLLVANYYDKKGDVANALDIFRKIANLDPGNLQVRVKLAGMFEKQKFPEKAAEEYVRAAQGYADKKEMDTAVQLYVRAFKLSPANSEARRRLADFYAQRQDWSVVVGLLETPVAKGSRDPDLLVLYAEALTRVNHPRDAVNVLEGAQEREPNSVPVNLALGRAYLKAGEVEKGTAAISRCVSVHLAENRLEPAESLLREMAEAAPDDDKIFQRVLEVAQKRGDKGSIAKAYLKLAAVYEKKKLVRSAIGAIEKFLELNPGDAAAIQRLEHLQAQTPAPKIEAPPPPEAPAPAPAPTDEDEDEVVEINLEEDGLAAVVGGVSEEELLIEVEGETLEAPTFEPTSVAEALAIARQGAPEKASEYLEEHLGRDPGDVEAWQALIEARRQLGNNQGVRDGLLRLASVHRRAAQFEDARAAFKGALDADPHSAAAARGLAELLIEEETAAATPVVTQPDVEEEISIDLFDQAIGETAVEPEPELLPTPEPEPVLVLEPEPEPVLVPEPEPEPVLVPEPEPEPEPAAEPVPTPEPEQVFDSVLADAEEVALDEAAPDETAPQFWDYQDFTEPAAEMAPPAAEPETQPVSQHALDQPALEEFTLEEFGEESTGLGTQAAEPPRPLPTAAPEAPTTTAAPGESGIQAGPGQAEFEEFLAEADFYFQQGLLDEAEFLYAKLLRLAPGHPVVTQQLRKLGEMRAPSEVGPEAAEIVDLDEELGAAFRGEPRGPLAAPPAQPSAHDLDTEVADFSDFLTGLRQELDTQPVPEPPVSPPPQPGVEEGLTEIFQEFQRSVKEQLGDEDFETHYNLGIAYKEMGLMDEAIAELTLAEKSPVRRLNAVSMIALCLREMGRFDESALRLRTGISLAVEGSEDQKGFLYDLAALHEQAGRATEAQETLRRLAAIDPGYRDVAARVGAAPPATSTPPRKKSKVSYL
jgi:tetratricopeptide (TPR) repeat protein